MTRECTASELKSEESTMRKKRPVGQFASSSERTRYDDRAWHNGESEISFYARSLRKAAHALIDKLNPEPSPQTEWDACPIILLYRQATELYLKSLVSEGSNFLPSPTDPLTLYKTHSLRWLAQIVCQIIKAVGWESEFTCEGVSSLADFSALVNELECLDPVSLAVHSGSREGSVAQHFHPRRIVQFAQYLDALLDLLDATADVLAATWDQQMEGDTGNDMISGANCKPTIH